MTIKKLLSGLLTGLSCLLFSLKAPAQLPENIRAVSPKELFTVLNNPGIGFNTFQHFNGDSVFPGMDWKEGYPIEYQGYRGSQVSNHYPATTIAYFRIYWYYTEPEKEKYNWALIDQALDSARQRGQKLLLRVAPYGPSQTDQDVPVWYRKMVGPDTIFRYSNPVNKWLVDPEDPRYVRYFGGFIRALGERYDGNPGLEGVDLSIVGAWGEGAGSELLSEPTMHGLIDAYTESFRKTALLVMLMDKKTNQYASSRGIHTGWRADCLGDLGFWAAEQNGWTHMYDYYPESIIDYGLQDAWKKAPVSFEICGTLLSWRDEQHYGEKEVKYIFDEALKWHMSFFNAKSSAVPKEWEPLVNEWLKKMGYRFVVRRFRYPKTVPRNGKLAFESWWENKGNAPCYIPYSFAVRLKGTRYTAVLPTAVDIRNWLPGDNVYNDAVFLPAGMPAGEYDLQLAILHQPEPVTGKSEPAVKLAIEGITADGWYSMGKIKVE